MFKNKTQCLLDIALISSFYINIYLSIGSSCSYTAKFVLDLLEHPSKAGFLICLICQRLYNMTTRIGHENYWTQFTEFTYVLQE